MEIYLKEKKDETHTQSLGLKNCFYSKNKFKNLKFTKQFSTLLHFIVESQF